MYVTALTIISKNKGVQIIETTIAELIYSTRTLLSVNSPLKIFFEAELKIDCSKLANLGIVYEIASQIKKQMIIPRPISLEYRM